jgi:hypothetical protein
LTLQGHRHLTAADKSSCPTAPGGLEIGAGFAAPPTAGGLGAAGTGGFPAPGLAATGGGFGLEATGGGAFVTVAGVLDGCGLGVAFGKAGFFHGVADPLELPPIPGKTAIGFAELSAVTEVTEGFGGGAAGAAGRRGGGGGAAGIALGGTSSR